MPICIICSSCSSDSKAESKRRTEAALKITAEAKGPVVEGAPTHEHDDTPKATSEQLIGKEVIRFQGLRVAYFTVDKETKLACLEDGVNAGRKEGDYLVLNRIVSLKEDSGKAA